MINFIICEDNKNVISIYESLIRKIAMPYDFDYKVYLFEKYDNKLKALIKNTEDLNIYLLDLELPGKSGIDIANEIRENDWDSIIIILTSHDELELRLFKNKLLIFDFISKFEDYEKRLTDSLNVILKKYSNNNFLTFKCNKEYRQVKQEEIIYVYKEGSSNKTMIVTRKDTYPASESLLSISSKLDNRFVKTHRACFVNKDKIKLINFKENKIVFENDVSITYLSRNYKNNLRGIK